MKPSPLVSIVTPSFNQGQFIEETIKSVLNQDYPNIEYIVMDGGSTDGTVEILEKYKDRLTYVSEKDKGQSDAINKGWRRAKGDIVAWLNSDDTYCPGAVRKAVEAFEQNPEAGLVHGNCNVTDASGRTIYRMRSRPVDLSDLLCFTIIHQPTVFLRRSVIESVGFLNPDLHFLMDHDYWVRTAFRFPLHHIPEFLACAREHPDAKSVAQGNQFSKDALTILDRVYSDPERARSVQAIRNRAYAGAHLMSSLWFTLAGERRAARESLKKALRLRPLLCFNELALPVILESATGIPFVRMARRIKHGFLRFLSAPGVL